MSTRLAAVFLLLALLSLPRPLRAQLGDPGAWSAAFPSSHAPDATVLCAIVHEGDLVVGGRFEFLDDQPLSHVARFDGAGWTALGAGLAYSPDELASTALGLVARRTWGGLDLFDGNAWHSLAPPTQADLRALCAFDGGLVVGTETAILRYDGSNWSILANFGSAALAVVGGELYAGAGFGAPGVAAVFDPVGGGWLGLGNEVQRKEWDWGTCGPVDPGQYTLSEGLVEAITEWNGDLVVGGGFHVIDGIDAFTDVARWDGAQWGPLNVVPDGYCEGLPGGERWYDGIVTQLGSFDGALLALSSQSYSPLLMQLSAPGTTPSLVARETRDFAVVDGALHLVGAALEEDVFGVGTWNGAVVVADYVEPISESRPFRFAFSLDAELFAVSVEDGYEYRWDPGTQSFHNTFQRYTTGCFEQGCTVYPNPPRAMVYYEGVRPSVGRLEFFGVDYPESGPVSEQGNALDMYQGELYVGGVVPTDAGIRAVARAVIDGSGVELESVGSGLRLVDFFELPEARLNVGVSDFVVMDEALIAAGDFVASDGGSFQALAAWDGDAWTAFGDPLGYGGGGYAQLFAAEAFQGELVVAGHFTESGATPLAGLAAWDGGAWRSLGDFDRPPRAMIATATHLIVGGEFTSIDGQPVAHLAAWDGTRWQEVAGGVDGPVDRLSVHDGGLIVLGDFRRAGTVDSQYIGWYGDGADIGIERLRFSSLTERRVTLTDLQLEWDSRGTERVLRLDTYADVGASGVLSPGTDGVTLLALGPSAAVTTLPSPAHLGMSFGPAEFVFPRRLTGQQTEVNVLFVPDGSDHTTVLRNGEVIYESTTIHGAEFPATIESFPTEFELILQNPVATWRRVERVEYAEEPSIVIESFEVENPVLLGGQFETRVHWTVVGATELSVLVGGTTFAHVTTEAVDTGEAPIFVFGDEATVTLRARNAVEVAEASLEVVRSAASVNSFTGDPNPILVGGSTTVAWSVIGIPSQVLLDGEPVDPVGSKEFFPLEPQTVVLDVMADGEIVDHRELGLEVLVPVPGEAPLIGLSTFEQTLNTSLIITPLVPTPVYVQGLGLEGGASAVDFSLVMPPGAFVLGFTPAAGVTRFGSGTDYRLLLDECASGDPIVLGSFQILATDALVDERILLRSSTQSLADPLGVSYQACESSRWTTVAGLPMRVVNSVPVLFFELEAEARVDGVQLSWKTRATDLEGFRVWKMSGVDWKLLEQLDAAAVRYFDEAVTPGSSEHYRVDLVQSDGTVVSREIEATPLSVLRTELLGNQPNPFNPSTTIRWAQARAGDATIEIYNVKGALVWSRRFASLRAGQHECVWNGTDRAGTGVSSGSYFVRLVTGDTVDQHRALLLK